MAAKTGSRPPSPPLASQQTTSFRRPWPLLEVALRAAAFSAVTGSCWEAAVRAELTVCSSAKGMRVSRRWRSAGFLTPIFSR